MKQLQKTLQSVSKSLQKLADKIDGIQRQIEEVKTANLVYKAKKQGKIKTASTGVYTMA